MITNARAGEPRKLPNAQLTKDQLREAFFTQIDQCLPTGTTSIDFLTADSDLVGFEWEYPKELLGLQLYFHPPSKTCEIRKSGFPMKWSFELLACVERFAQACGCKYDDITYAGRIIDDLIVAKRHDKPTIPVESQLFPAITTEEQQHYWTSILLTAPNRDLRQFAKLQLERLKED